MPANVAAGLNGRWSMGGQSNSAARSKLSASGRPQGATSASSQGSAQTAEARRGAGPCRSRKYDVVKKYNFRPTTERVEGARDW
jgi:hypothetical protein